MTALSFYSFTDKSEIRLWSLSASFVVGIHVLLICALVFWYTSSPEIDGTGGPSVMIDLESVAPTPDAKKLDLPPGELMREAPPPTPEPVEKEVETKEEIAPTPRQEKPVVMLPTEQKEKPKPLKDKPKPVVEKRPPIDSTPAPRTSAPAIAAQAARASYNGMVSSHLQHFKNPSAASAQGVAMVSFTLGRSGNLMGSHLAGSSGSSALDAEAMSMVRRAQPYPAFLAAMTESSISFTVPVRFTQR